MNLSIGGEGTRAAVESADSVQHLQVLSGAELVEVRRASLGRSAPG